MHPSHDPDSEDRYPKYTIHTASRLTGLKAGTLRAWERRYGIPTPHRSASGHRLYAEYDLRLLRWLSAQTGAGMTIRRAVDFLRHLRSHGEDPAGMGRSHRGQPLGDKGTRDEVNQGGRS